jgi:hypothetical protein
MVSAISCSTACCHVCLQVLLLAASLQLLRSAAILSRFRLCDSVSCLFQQLVTCAAVTLTSAVVPLVLTCLCSHGHSRPIVEVNYRCALGPAAASSADKQLNQHVLGECPNQDSIQDCRRLPSAQDPCLLL